MRFSFMAVLLAVCPFCFVTANDALAQIESSTKVNGREVVIRTDKQSHTVRVAFAGSKTSVIIELPKSVERVTELLIAPWMESGVVAAIEARDSKTKELSYHWITAWVDAKKQEVLKPVVAEFYRSKVDYDIASVRNSGGDSIYIILAKHVRDSPMDHVIGYAFTHNCPIGPVPGELLKMETANELEQKLKAREPSVKAPKR